MLGEYRIKKISYRTTKDKILVSPPGLFSYLRFEQFSRVQLTGSKTEPGSCEENLVSYREPEKWNALIRIVTREKEKCGHFSER
jgi:hypothetical protein